MADEDLKRKGSVGEDPFAACKRPKVAIAAPEATPEVAPGAAPEAAPAAPQATPILDRDESMTPQIMASVGKMNADKLSQAQKQYVIDIASGRLGLLPDAERAKIVGFFNKLDTDKSGTLTVEDFASPFPCVQKIMTAMWNRIQIILILMGME